MSLCRFIENIPNLIYKCVLDCPRKSEKIISRYPSCHYIIDPQISLIQLLGINAANKFDPVLRIFKEYEKK